MGKQFLPLIRHHVTNVINAKVTISLKTSDISQTTHTMQKKSLRIPKRKQKPKIYGHKKKDNNTHT